MNRPFPTFTNLTDAACKSPESLMNKDRLP